MQNLLRLLLGALLGVVTIEALPAGLVSASAIGAYYGASLFSRINDRSFKCTPTYRCRTQIQWRFDSGRYGRRQEVRERPAQSEPLNDGPAYGPWGPQRYVPPATPEANIQPAYRSASRLRPEYERSGQLIGEPTTDIMK
jgi:hypothetical protein